MIRNIGDLDTIIHSLECERFEMTDKQVIRVLATILYRNEVYSNLTSTQLDKLNEILNKFEK